MVELRSLQQQLEGIVAAALLDKGADDVKDKDGETALLPAVVEGHADVVEVPTEGVDVQVRNQLGDTPFMVAALQGIASCGGATVSVGMQQRLLC